MPYGVYPILSSGQLPPGWFRDAVERVPPREIPVSIACPNYFGNLHRGWKARRGTPKAITAMTHTEAAGEAAKGIRQRRRPAGPRARERTSPLGVHSLAPAQVSRSVQPGSVPARGGKCNASSAPAYAIPPLPSASNSSPLNDWHRQLIGRHHSHNCVRM